jgi:hypothetical protein
MPRKKYFDSLSRATQFAKKVNGKVLDDARSLGFDANYRVLYSPNSQTRAHAENRGVNQSKPHKRLPPTPPEAP